MLGIIEEPNAEWLQELDQNLLKGLHSGDLDLAAYMFLQGNYGWLAGLLRVAKDSASCGQDLYLESGDIKVSLWRYIEGTNVTIFADPNVEGRYHFGVTPADDQDNWPAIGDYLVDAGQHEQPQTFRKHKQPFIAEAIHRDLRGHSPTTLFRYHSSTCYGTSKRCKG